MFATNRWNYTASAAIALSVLSIVWGCVEASATRSGRIGSDSASVVVVPRVLEADLRQIRVPPAWAPGSPVREVADLRRIDVPAETVTLARHAIQRRGRTFTIYSVVDGARIAGPLPFGSFWARSAWPCGSEVARPPSVQADRAAGRWLISRWMPPTPEGKVPYCVAISRTSDPVTGGWWRYEFALPIPRIDAPLELSNGVYRVSAESVGSTVHIAFDREAMLAGRPSGYTASAADNFVRRAASRRIDEAR